MGFFTNSGFALICKKTDTAEPGVRYEGAVCLGGYMEGFLDFQLKIWYNIIRKIEGYLGVEYEYIPA